MNDKWLYYNFFFISTENLPSKPKAIILANPELLIAANDDSWTPPKQFA